MIVLAFDRDWTVDVNPPPDREAVPLDWVQYWAHKTDHEVWAIGKQDLVYEAGIPGVVEAVRRYHGNLNKLGEQDDAGRYEWWPSRERRLELLAELFPDAFRYIVVDDLDLSHVEGWDHYTAWEFREEIEEGRLRSYLPLPSNEDGPSNRTSSKSDHVQTVRQELRNASEVEIVVGDEAQETFRSRSWKKPRPSARPINAPPALDFTTTSGETRRVQIPDIAEVTVVAEASDTESDTGSERTTEVELPDTGMMLGRADQADCFTTAQRVEYAIDVLKVATKLEALPRKLMSEFTSAVEDVPADDAAPAVQASKYAAQHPSYLRHHVGDLCNLTGVSDVTVSRRAVWCLMEVAEGDPQTVLDAVPALSVALERDDETIQTYATYTLTCISKHHPEEVLPVLDTLIDQIEAENQNIRTNSLSAVGHVVDGYPDAAVESADDIATLLESDEKRVRNNAAGLLADIAQQHPDVVINYADTLANRLDDSNIQARINTSIALLRAGEANPEVIRKQHEPLDQALNDASPEVRANTCALVANAEVPVSVEKLQQLRANDPDETVRDHASWAIRRLS